MRRNSWTGRSLFSEPAEEKRACARTKEFRPFCFIITQVGEPILPRHDLVKSARLLALGSSFICSPPAGG